ncbi:hypothetical protein Rumal_3891 (plasmid) [Ruminococcus albus 7 = DSM 20455]|uniref:TrbC/VIRB2 family protein n=2 Tax=Ruminococcus albus TaxID=1264 RepID=E6UKW9_RUMA7|nr:hypothetical protein Rumal_3891 [Ruminococcus albus 7 = DSM 20455]
MQMITLIIMMNFKEMVTTKWIRNKAAEIKTAFKEDFTRNSELTVEQRDRKRERAVRRISMGFMAVMMMTSLFGITAFAEGEGGGGDGVETFNTVVQFIVDWVARIGLVIGFIGAIQFALGFKDDSADGKTRGLMCLASGFIVFAVAKAYDMFTM